MRRAAAAALPLLLLLLWASQPQPAAALDNGLGRLPPLAWRTWNAFNEHINQTIVVGMIDELVAQRLDVDGKPTSLRELGYGTIGIDQGWEGCGMGVNGTQHYANGTPAVNSKFPDLKALVEYGHAHDVKMGFYLNGCACGERQERLINYQGDVGLTHRLGFDAVKIDGCGAQLNMTLYAELFNKTGRPIMTENCHAGENFTDGGTPGQMGPGWCPYNFFRSSGDIKSVWDRVIANLLSVTKFLVASKTVSVGASRAGGIPSPPRPPAPPGQGAAGAPASRPGCFAYPDMLEVGRMEGSGQSSAAMSEAESSSHFAGWCIVSAPLVLGFDLANATRMELTWPHISNRRAMAVSQTWQADRPDPTGSLLKTWQAPNLESVVVGCGCASPCVNRNASCSAWAEANQCAENPRFMRTTCPKSCSTDSQQSGWKLQPSGLVTTPSGACLDAAGQLPALDAGPNWLRTRKCDPSSATQKFAYGGSQLKAHDGRCLGVVMHWLWTQPMVSLLECGGGKTFVALDVETGTLDSGSGYGCFGVSRLAGPPSTLWRKPLPDGQTAVLAINGAALPQRITLNVSEVLAPDAPRGQLAEGAAAHATDVWSGKELGTVSTVTRTVPAHGNIFLTLSPPK